MDESVKEAESALQPSNHDKSDLDAAPHCQGVLDVILQYSNHNKCDLDATTCHQGASDVMLQYCKWLRNQESMSVEGQINKFHLQLKKVEFG